MVAKKATGRAKPKMTLEKLLADVEDARGRVDDFVTKLPRAYTGSGTQVRVIGVVEGAPESTTIYERNRGIVRTTLTVKLKPRHEDALPADVVAAQAKLQ